MKNIKNMIEDALIERVDNLLTDGFVRNAVQAYIDEHDNEIADAIFEAMQDTIKEAFEDQLEEVVDAAVEGVM